METVAQNSVSNVPRPPPPLGSGSPGYLSIFVGAPTLFDPGNNYGGDGGPAINASIGFPIGIAVHPSSGDVVFADQNNNIIWSVSSSSGTISVIAGQYGNSALSDNMTFANATGLNGPVAVAYDNSTNLYIVDSKNNLIRCVNPLGTITTIAGQIGVTTGSFSGDGQLAIHAGIKLVNGYDTVSQPSSANALFTGIAYYQGSLYFSDCGNRRVRAIDLGTGIITTVAGSGSYPPSTGSTVPGVVPGCLITNIFDGRSVCMFLSQILTKP